MDGGVFHTELSLFHAQCVKFLFVLYPGPTHEWPAPTLLFSSFLIVTRNCIYTSLCVGVYNVCMCSWVGCHSKMQSCTKSHHFIPYCDSFISQSVWNVRSCLPDRVWHGRRWFSSARSRETIPSSQPLARTWRTSSWQPDRSVNKPFQPLPSGNLL